jgi:hypothetical protein
VTPNDLTGAGTSTAAQITFVPVGDPNGGNVPVKSGNSTGDDASMVLTPPEPTRTDGSTLGFPEVNAETQQIDLEEFRKYLARK